MTKHITRKLLVACLVLALPVGCGGEAKKQDQKAAKAEKKPEAKPELEKPAEKPAEDEGPKPSMDTPEGRVTLAALVASEIADAPDKADEILEQNGLDRDQLDHLMYEIARDPELSKAYKEKRMEG